MKFCLLGILISVGAFAQDGPGGVFIVTGNGEQGFDISEICDDPDEEVYRFNDEFEIYCDEYAQGKPIFDFMALSRRPLPWL